MPKNKGAGGKNRRKGKGGPAKPKELVYKEDGEEYGQISKSLGNGFMEVTCFSSTGNISRRAHIRGSMRKKVWMAVGDIVLISTRGYQEQTCDIIMKYTSDEARVLRARKQLPDNVDINKTDMIAEESSVIFGEDSDLSDAEANENKTKVAKQKRNLDLPESDSDSSDD